MHEIILGTRKEVRDTVEAIIKLNNKYGEVSVADVYELVGIPSTYLDNQMGWKNLTHVVFQRVRTGYVLKFAEPERLNEVINSQVTRNDTVPRPLREIWTPQVVNRSIAEAALSVALGVSATIAAKQLCHFTSATLRDLSWILMQKKLYGVEK